MTTKTSMTITKFVEMAKMLPEDISVLIRGDHGIGKSEIVAQLADYFREKEFGNEKDAFPLIDRRMSQMSEGDVIGLPIMDGITTNFCPPMWYQLACDKPVMLFLDEINRATHEVLQSCFQIILSRELNGRKLHPQTRVMAAVNTGASYVINEMDPALLDRFWVIDLDPLSEEWIAWAKSCPDMIPWVIDFVRANPRFLDPPKDVEPGSVTQSRRSWHRLCRTLRKAGLAELPEDPKQLDDRVYTLSLGFIGTEASIAFVDYVKNIERQVSGKDVVEKLVKKVGQCKPKMIGGFGKEPDDYEYNEALIKRIESNGQEQLVGLSEKVVDEIKAIYAANVEKLKADGKDVKKADLTKKQGAALGKFFSMIPPEVRMSAWANLTKDGADNIEFIRVIHKWVIAGVMDVFGVPLDSDGTVQPKIPEFLQSA